MLDFSASKGVDLASEGGPGQRRWTWLLAKQKERNARYLVTVTMVTIKMVQKSSNY
jgi:hypothetical protein